MLNPEVSATVRFVNPAALVKAIPLRFPVECNGVVYDTVCLKRLTAAEVAVFVKTFTEARKADPDITPRFPIYVDAAGAPIPVEVMDALETDDFDTVDEAALDFLPRRFRPAPEPTTSETGSIPNSGGPTEPSSAT